ncbi:MAG: flagellar protein [Amphibacillus sp.]|nr:flagellar protein [Amphibacillus sp.]
MHYQIQHVPKQALLHPKQQKITKTHQQTSSFQTILDQTQAELKISKHAQSRLNERKIEISNEKWQEISKQILEARQKGITDSLVITREATLLVSAKNHTVVTALDHHEAQSRIFTNINGAILID